MKRIAFFSIIALALMGCGGGSGESVTVTQKINNTDRNTNSSHEQNETIVSDTTKDTDANASASTNPYPDPFVSEEDTDNVDQKTTLSHEQNETIVPDTTKDTDADTSASTNPYPVPFVSEEDKEIFLQVINTARAEGQDCGKIDSHGIPVTDSNGNYIYDGSNIMSPTTTALIWSDTLYAAAYEHSNDLAQSDTASHSGSGTASDWTGMDMGGVQSTFVDRARNNGYTFSRLGENISMGTHRDTIQKAVDSWLASPRHCVNLMNPLYTEVGIGYVEKEGTLYRNYWTQVLGTPSN